MAKGKQIEILKKVIKPKVCLTEQMLKGIKDLSIDDEVKLVLKAKVTEISKERDYYDMPISGYEEMPKVLKADFEIQEVMKQ